MAWHIYKNSTISASTYTDLAGNTGCTYPNAGERELATLAAFEGHQSYNQDATLTAMPALNATISRLLLCDMCGKVIKNKDKSRLVRNNDGYWVCPSCVDEE